MRYRLRDVLGILVVIFLGIPPFTSEGIESLELQSIQQSLDIPDALAHVTDAYWPSVQRPPDYILIQDVHRHPKVQAQIASLIIHGYYAWGVRKVFLEGAFTSLDLSMFHRVPNKTRSLLTERLVRDGDLSGPELAAVQILEREWRDPPVSPFQLFGMEDPKLYRQNVLAYQSVLSQRDRALEDLIPIRRLQNSMHLSEPNLLNQQLDRVEDLLRLKLTPAEYDAYLQGKAEVPSTPALDPAVHAAEEFYRLAQLRSRIFLKQAANKVPASSAPRILVVGGFHTAFMAECLRLEGHSFIVLAPSVEAGQADPIYEKRMKETSDALTQALVPAPR